VSATQALTNKDIDGGTASNTNRVTLPQNTTANLAALTRKEGTLAYDTTLNTPVFDDGAAFVQITGGGGGSGTGAINHLTGDDVDAESTVGNWLAYADAAGVDPVDGTAGAPTTTVTRTIASPLRGTGSFLLTKDAADRQGEGGSVDFAIERADSLTPLRQEVKFNYEASAAFVTGDDSDLKVFIYDVDQASLISIQNNSVRFANGIVSVPFDVEDVTSVNYRLILHIATVNASAWTFTFDNVSVGPVTSLAGAAMTDWEEYTPTGTWVSNTTYNGRWRRVGDSMELQLGIELTGVPTATSLAIDLPPGYLIDLTKLPDAATGASGVMFSGIGRARDTGTASYALAGGWGSGLGDNSILIFEINGPTSIVNQAVPFTWVSGDDAVIHVMVPIVGWSSNVSVGNGQTFRISNIIANGTRVTATPTKLGEWRSQLRNASARTFTDTNGDPTVQPSSSDGILVYAGNGWTSADTNNQPSRYEIFVGQNKQIKSESYGASTGRNGSSSFDVHNINTVGAGCAVIYNPVSGVVTVVGFVEGTNTIQFTSRGGTFDNVIDTYFDIVVSENVQAIGIDFPLNLWQLKAVPSNVSTDGNLITFNNLQPGKIYRFTAVTRWIDPAAGDSSWTTQVNHDSVTLYNYSHSNVSGDLTGQGMDNHVGIFEATNSVITFDVTSFTGGGQTIFGNGTRQQSHMILEELNDYDLETTAFT